MDQTTKPSTTAQETTTAPSLAAKARNFLVVGVAVILSVLVVMGVRTQTPAASLETLAVESTPLETALTNGKPSLMEFYANWCTSCQAMAGDMADLRSTYGDDINFVMLNVDNNKWLPEMLHYRVDGIPHFVYLNPQGEPVTAAIGEQPKAVIASNLEALMTGATLPYQQGVGQTSNLDEPTTRSVVINSINRSDDPRSHGAQAAN
ncbi:thioredoxin family protein [Leptolyngbya iicbica]|uniref:Thiol:disulfide interchange protein n=2 Tax=Cyanophyceae TaxID=3028117 RepID=A0A4Q7E959_9CYAN|nr:thioredoxin family protein [Leptolyngbya sp. LK]RZM78919.1 thiol:disulfide interchange protein [Leptolyngbya sp. LK]